MRRRSAAVLAVLALAAPAAASDAVLVDRIVAVVNKDVITLSELGARTALAERELERRRIAAPPRPVLQRQVLERLVLDKAQVQFAEDTGLRIDELQLDRALQRVAHSNNLTVTEFRRALERDGVSLERFRADLRQQMLQSRLREREVDDRV